MEIPDFLYTTSLQYRRGVVWLVVVFLLSAGVAGCASTHRSHPGPVSVPARPTLPEEAPVEQEPGLPEDAGVYHVVRPGQTLWRIARAYGLTPGQLAEANGIADPARIEAGRALFVPGATKVVEVIPYPGPVEPGPAGRAERIPAGTAAADWSWPVAAGEVLSYFGAPRRTHRHAGIDIRGRAGESVVATRAGLVAYSGEGMRGYGKTVIVDHGDGLSSLYAHNSKLLVRRGQRVERGQPVARVGRTGNASTEHCHFEIRRDDRPVDPLLFLLPPLEARR